MDIGNSEKKNMPPEIAKVLVRMPETMRRKLKVVAAMFNRSLNEQIVEYMKEGLMKTEAKILSNPQGIMNIEESE
jgi:hypothetical protein